MENTVSYYLLRGRAIITFRAHDFIYINDLANNFQHIRVKFNYDTIHLYRCKIGMLNHCVEDVQFRTDLFSFYFIKV